MDKKAADRERQRQPDSDPPPPKIDLSALTNESIATLELIPPHYAIRDFDICKNNRMFGQKKGDIIRDQQKLFFYKQENAPIELFDESQTAKCPNPKCGCVFAWVAGANKEA